MLKSEVKKYHNLIDDYLATEKEYLSQATKDAMNDLLLISREMLAGNYEFPVTRNREFCEEDYFDYALDYFSRAPSYQMTHYGLRPAFEWLKKQHILYLGEASLPNKKAELIKNVEEFIDEAKVTETASLNTIGHYPAEVISNLSDLLNELKHIEVGSHELAKKIVKLMNYLNLARKSQILLSDVEQGSSILLSAKQLKVLKTAYGTNTSLGNEIKEIEKIANTHTLADIDRLAEFSEVKHSYSRLNHHYNLWSDSGTTINFYSPATATQAKIRFVLPEIENEQAGLGHVWIDDVQVYSAQGADWEIENNGFEDIENGRLVGWHPLKLKGEPLLKIEKEAPFNGREKQSVYLENSTLEDSGGWESDTFIKVTENTNHTIRFSAKQDGKFKKGLKIEVLFFNEETYLDSFVYYFNRKSSIGGGSYGLHLQADAIIYLLKEDITYAHKTKKQIDFVLNDFCQGIEHWQKYDSRPDNSDAYGAVQGGRILCSLMTSYDLIKHSGVYSETDKQKLIAQLEYFIRYLMDLRDRTELSNQEAQADAGNWQTDMAAGIGFLTLAMPEFPNSRQWLLNANKILRSQLFENVNDDGSWPESIRYHFAATMRFLSYARLLERNTGENWFSDGPLVKMLKYPTEMLYPPYYLDDDKVSTIPYGDHDYKENSWLALYYQYAGIISNYDYEFSEQMLLVWELANKPKIEIFQERVLLEVLLAELDNLNMPQTLPERQFSQESTDAFPQGGIYPIRDHVGLEKESLMSIMAPLKKIDHGHYDVGSLSLWHNKEPLIVDPGIESYFDSSKDWYVSSSAHSLLQLARPEGPTPKQPFDIHLEVTNYSGERGWFDVPRFVTKADFSKNEKEESLLLEINYSKLGAIHQRKVTYLKTIEAYLVEDRVTNYEGVARFSLNTATVSSVKSDNYVKLLNQTGLELEVIILGQESLEITTEWGRCHQSLPQIEGASKTQIVRIEKNITNAANSLSVLLHPKRSEEDSLKLEKKNNKLILNNSKGIQLI